jgi:hypothetical protein
MLTGRKLAVTLAFTVLVALAFGAGCRGFFVKGTVTSITVGPTGVTLAPGATLQMVAMGAMSDGSPPQNVTKQCFWNSSNSAAATIGQNTGFVTVPTTITNPPQTTTITADFQALTPVTATLSACPTLTNLTISGSPLTVPKGTATPITFTAEATFTGGMAQSVLSEVTWNITNTSLLPSIGTNGVGTTSGDGTAATATVTANLCNFPSNALTITAN